MQCRSSVYPCVIQVAREWQEKGGVLLIGYELYRILVSPTSKGREKERKRRRPKGEKVIKQRTLLASCDMFCVFDGRLDNRSKCLGVVAAVAISVQHVIDLEDEEAVTEMENAMVRCLLNPGSDVIVCDEGHRIKSRQANVSVLLKRVRTRRRIVLTGYQMC